MDVLVLGGTAWVGREIARQAVERGDRTTCLARGVSGPPVDGARWVTADRNEPGAYADVCDQEWDLVIDVARSPGQVRSAVPALADVARHWVFVSSCSVYADHGLLQADETAETLPPGDGGGATPEAYGGGKVACELACQEALSDRLLVARVGLIGGPGDHTGRSGAWVARAARDPDAPMLVPAGLDAITQVVDVRDLAAWLLLCGHDRLVGVVDAVGPQLSLGDWIELSRRVGGHSGPIETVADQWLLDHGVETFMGVDSIAMWLGQDPGWVGFMARSGQAAVRMGLAHRDRESLLQDVLRWEREQGLSRPRSAGLSPERERQLLTSWARPHR